MAAEEIVVVVDQEAVPVVEGEEVEEDEEIEGKLCK